jgi:hypothetical protein
MGGVTAGEIGRVTLALVTTLFFSLAVGIFISACARDARQTISGTLLCLIAFTAVLPGLWWIARTLGKGQPWDALLWPSPVYLYSHSFDVFYSFRSGSTHFFQSWGVLVALSAGCLFMSSAYLPHAWHQKGDDASGSPAGSRLRRWRFGSKGFQKMRRGLLDANPFYWLAGRDRLPQFGVRTGIAILTAIWFGFYYGCFSKTRGVPDVCFGGCLGLGYGIHQLLKTYIAIEATRRLSEDRHSGALELLLVTPLRVTQILAGIKAALFDIFVWPVLFALSLNLALFWMLAGPNPLRMQGEAAGMFCEMVVGGAIVLISDMTAMTWAGMAMAVKKSKHQRAILAAFGRVMLFPWLGILFFFFLSIGGSGWSTGDVIALIALWFFGSFILDVVVAARSRVGLEQSLRDSTYQPTANFAPAQTPAESATLGRL